MRTTRYIGLFVLISVIDAPLTLGGSVVGALSGNLGLFLGAIAGGLAGVVIAAGAAAGCGLIPHAAVLRTVMGAVVGFVLASVISLTHLEGPIVPALSGMLIGIGGVAGSVVRRDEGPRL